MKRRALVIPRGAAIAALLTLVIAVPVAADVGLQNFMRAEVATTAPCLVTSAGADATDGSDFLTFDSTATVEASGVELVQEKLAIRAFAGDRLFYSEALVITNTCDIDLSVTFFNTDDPAGGLALEPASGLPWDAMNLRFYLQDPAGAAVAGLPDNYVAMLEVLTGTVTAAGTSIVPAGQSRTLAVTVDTDGSVAAGSVGVIRWEAVASNI